MAAELKTDLGLVATLIEGGNGVFDVKVDGRLVYSKGRSHQFPAPGEVSGLMRST